MANTFPVADTAGVVEQGWRLGQEAGLVDVRPVGAVTMGLEGTALAELVKAGTISQAQADAISKKLDEQRAKMDANKSAHKATHEAHRAEVEALVASTLGIDAATIKTRLAAGETLGAIAGTKKPALISALVALETKEIDARVTAGTLTAAQAATLKANLTDHVTKMVDSVKGPKDGKGHKGHKGMGKGPRH